MLKLKTILAILFLFITFQSKAAIQYSEYDSLVNYYENHLEETHLEWLGNVRKQGITYQEFFNFQIVFTDYVLFFNNNCKHYPTDISCLKKIAKVEATIADLEFFAKFENEPLNVSIFEQWKENAMQGKPTFDLSEKGKDWKYITIVLDKVEDINTHTK